MDNDQVVTANDNALGAEDSAEAAVAATPPKRPVRTRRKALPKKEAPADAADTAAASADAADSAVAAVPAEASDAAVAPAAEAQAKAPVRRSRARKVAEPAEPLPAFADDAAAPATEAADVPDTPPGQSAREHLVPGNAANFCVSLDRSLASVYSRVAALWPQQVLRARLRSQSRRRETASCGPSFHRAYL